MSAVAVASAPIDSLAGDMSSSSSQVGLLQQAPTPIQKKIWDWFGDWNVCFYLPKSLIGQSATSAKYLTGNCIEAMLLSDCVFSRLYYVPTENGRSGLLAYRLAPKGVRTGSIHNEMEYIAPLYLMKDRENSVFICDFDVCKLDETDYCPEVVQEMAESEFLAKYPVCENWLQSSPVQTPLAH